MSTGIWLIKKRQKGGDIRPEYHYGCSGNFDCTGDNLGGLVTYIPAAIETGVKAIISTIQLPYQIGQTLVSDNPPNPNEIHLQY